MNRLYKIIDLFHGNNVAKLIARYNNAYKAITYNLKESTNFIERSIRYDLPLHSDLGLFSLSFILY